MRLDLDEVLRELVDRLGVRDGRGSREEEIVDHPLEHVRERQEGQGARVARHVEERRARGDVRHEVLVRQNRALRLARGAGRVDHRREVTRKDRRRALLEGARVRAQGREALLDHGRERRGLPRAPRHVVENDHVLELGAAVADIDHLLELDRARDDDDLRERIPQDVLDLGREVARVDRHAERAEGKRREVRHRPLGPVLREDRDAVVPVDAEEREPQREALRALSEVRGRERRPGPADLRDEELRLAARGGEAKVVEQSFRGKRFEHDLPIHYAGDGRRPAAGEEKGSRAAAPRSRARRRSLAGSPREPPPAAPVPPGCGRTRPPRPRRRRSPSSRR